MSDFACDIPAQKIIAGAGCTAGIRDELMAIGCSRALVVCSASVRRSALLQAGLGALGEACVGLFDEVVQHSGVELVSRGAEMARRLSIDCLVAVGGGSSSDTAKAIAILLAEGAPLEQHASRFVYPDRFYPKPLHQPKLPLLSIPTTASAAEMTPGLGVRNAAGEKLLFWDVKLASRVILLDEKANVEVPAAIMATTAMNGLAHCVEGLYSRLRNPISEGLALQGARLFHSALPKMVAAPDDPAPRGQVLTAASLSGMVISNARVGVHHATCHCLGARGGLPHGVANAVMLPHALAYNLEVAASQLALLGEALGVAGNGSERRKAERTIAAIAELQHAAGVPTRLRDTGLDRGLLPAIAEDTLRDRGLYFNPRRTESAEPILRMLEAAW